MQLVLLKQKCVECLRKNRKAIQRHLLCKHSICQIIMASGYIGKVRGARLIWSDNEVVASFLSSFNCVAWEVYPWNNPRERERENKAHVKCIKSCYVSLLQHALQWISALRRFASPYKTSSLVNYTSHCSAEHATSSENLKCHHSHLKKIMTKCYAFLIYRSLVFRYKRYKMCAVISLHAFWLLMSYKTWPVNKARNCHYTPREQEVGINFCIATYFRVKQNIIRWK